MSDLLDIFDWSTQRLREELSVLTHSQQRNDARWVMLLSTVPSQATQPGCQQRALPFVQHRTKKKIEIIRQELEDRSSYDSMCHILETEVRTT